MKLDVKAFALTCALVWGLGLLAITWWIILFEGQAAAGDPPPFLGLVYRGYQLNAVGSLIGLAWAFFDAWIGGAVFAWLYNRLRGREGAA